MSSTAMSDFDVLSKGLSNKEIDRAKQAHLFASRYYAPTSRMAALSQVMTNPPYTQLDFRQAHRLFGQPISHLRGSCSYSENVGSSRYLKQNVNTVVLFMDILHDEEFRFVAAISDVGNYHHIQFIPNSTEKIIQQAIASAVACWTNANHNVEEQRRRLLNEGATSMIVQRSPIVWRSFQ